MQENNENNQKQGGLSWSTPSVQGAPANKPADVPVKTPVAISDKTIPGKSMGADEGSGASRYFTVVIVGIVAGAVIAWGYSVWHRSATVAQENNTAPTYTTSTADKNLGVDTTSLVGLGSDSSFTIPSPQAAGTSVAIATVIVSAPTWIVIYEDNDGKPGNALGAGLFFADHQAGTVELLRSTTPGKNYLAVKQVDNGDRKFSLKDDQYLSEGGAVQWVTFQTQ